MALTRLDALIAAGQYRAAGALARELAETCRDEPQALNRVAWAMVDPRNQVPRGAMDLALAERMAARASMATQMNNPEILNTLARVLFVRGRVERAITVQIWAIVKADSLPMRRMLRKTLGEYQAWKRLGR